MTKKKSKKAIKKQAKAAQKTSHTPWIYGAIGIFLLSLLFYLPTANYELTHLDDNKHLIEYQSINEDMGNISETFSRVYYGKFYRPVLTISYILDTNIIGSDFEDYHMSNVLMHASGSALVFLVLIAMGFNQKISLVLSAFFALHPILTPAVAWIPGRNDSLLGIMIFSSFLFLVLFIKIKNNLYLLFHFIFYMLALFTKEVAAVFPFVCFAYVVLSQKEKIVNPRNLTLGAIWLGGGLVWFFMRQAALENLIGKGAEFGFKVFMESFQVIFAQAGKILFPYRMVAFSSVEFVTVISGLILLSGLAYLAFTQSKNKNYFPWFGLIWFILFVLPPLFFRLSFADEFMDYAEHRTYVPMLGIIVAIAEVLRYFKIEFRKPLAIGITAVLLVLFGAKAFTYQNVFENRISFWTHSTEMYPDKSRAYSDLGIVYYDEGDFKTAEKHFLKAYEVNPEDPYANFNLGKVYVQLNQKEKSLEHYKKAIAADLNPKWHVDIGVAYIRMKMYDEAIASFTKALKVYPNDLNAHLNIGAAYAMSGRGNIAVGHWQKALQINPSNWGPYNNLIRFYYSEGDYKTALQYADALASRRGKADPDVGNIIQLMRNQAK